MFIASRAILAAREPMPRESSGNTLAKVGNFELDIFCNCNILSWSSCILISFKRSMKHPIVEVAYQISYLYGFLIYSLYVGSLQCLTRD